MELKSSFLKILFSYNSTTFNCLYFYSKMSSLAITFWLATKARQKLTQECSKNDHNLRALVTHANFLDDLVNTISKERSQLNQCVIEFPYKSQNDIAPIIECEEVELDDEDLNEDHDNYYEDIELSSYSSDDIEVLSDSSDDTEDDLFMAHSNPNIITEFKVVVSEDTFHDHINTNTNEKNMSNRTDPIVASAQNKYNSRSQT